MWLALCSIFVPDVPMWLVIVKNGKCDKGLFRYLFNLLCVIFASVVLESHHVIIVPILFCYLNEAEIITTSDSQIFPSWLMGGAF